MPATLGAPPGAAPAGSAGSGAPAAGATRPAAGEGGRRKLARNATDPDRDKKKCGNIQGENKKLKQLMLKAILRGEQRGRDMESCLFDTLTGRSDAAEVMAMSEQNTNYGAAVKESGKGHDHGPPFIWTYGGLLTSLCQQGEKIGQANAVAMRAILNEYQDLSVQEKCDRIKFCRVSKMFDQQQKRITLCFPMGVADKQRGPVLASLVQLGWQRKQGRAPPTHLERELQAWLDVLLES